MAMGRLVLMDIARVFRRKNVGRASPTRTASVARSIRRAIRRGWPSGALDIVNDPKNKRYLTAAEEGQLRG